ncbi:MAG TPA: hypothetical protein VK866_17695, partial [Acidimicrobiales bacterium]|nr:hypothetical protein [Acidimicrobiales bacterium]
MPTHTMRFTALPAGLDSEGHARVSAHAAFKLDPGATPGTLADFPVALGWPDVAIDWQVTFRRGAATLTVDAAAVEQRERDKWDAIFRPTQAVRSFAEPVDRAARPIRSYRNARLAQRWRDTYASLAESLDPGGDRPAVGADPAAGPLAGFESAGLWSDARRKEFNDEILLAGLDAEIAAKRYVPADLGGSPAEQQRRDILEFRRFFRRQIDDPAAPVPPPDLDFHELTTACAAHPGLLRPLGLVFDLTVVESWPGIRAAHGGYPEMVTVVGRPGLPVLAGDGDGGNGETTPIDETASTQPSSDAFVVPLAT